MDRRPRTGVGGAAPCVLRSGSRLPVVGVMVLDSADLWNDQSGLLYDVVSHELGHVLGFGALWRLHGLVASGNEGDTYNGEFGRTAFHGLVANAPAFFRAGVPIDNSGLPGTHQAHWAEAVGTGFDLELMTSFASATNVLSAISIASLRDLGYLTTDIAAESFEFPPFSPSAWLRAPPRPRRERTPSVRSVMVDDRGRVIAWPRSSGAR
ncbi:MAG: leishmanolysin-related zinc metalloendopeptidase [Gemmatimonadales bacterium]